MSDAPEPSVWEVMALDPSVAMDRATLRLVIADQRLPSRRYLYPWVRVASRVAVTAIVAVKRLLGLRFAAHTTMDGLCLWFLRRFVSPGAVSLLIRHFVVETNLLNFCVRNAGVPGIGEASLRPTSVAGLGDRAVIEHDLNVYRVLAALGGLGTLVQRDIAELDFSMLTVPAIDAAPRWRRSARLDIQTALCLMNIPFACCLTPAEYQRAVHSLRLDTSLLWVLARLTGDRAFLGWGPASLPVRVDSAIDVPAGVYEHAVRCEYAHARLLALRDAECLRSSGAAGRAQQPAVGR